MGRVEIKKPPTLKMINSQEEKSLAEWEALYPEVWMFLEVTAETEGWQIAKARLIATAEDQAEFIELARSYQQSQTPFTMRRGGPEEEDRPVIVATPFFPTKEILREPVMKLELDVSRALAALARYYNTTPETILKAFMADLTADLLDQEADHQHAACHLAGQWFERQVVDREFRRS